MSNPDEIKSRLQALADEHQALMDKVDEVKSSIMSVKNEFCQSGVYSNDISGNGVSASDAMGAAEEDLYEAEHLLLNFQNGIRQLHDAIGNA